MKNILAYYYSLHPEEIHHKDDKYFFEYLDSKYVFEPFKRPLGDIDCLYKVNRQMTTQNLLVHEIIINNENRILTYVNNVPYVLMETFVNDKAGITLAEVCHINNGTMNVECDKILDRYDWITLWETKNDYFEAQINEVGKRYPHVSTYVNYYIGIAENAISYVRNALLIQEPTYKSICHKRINFNGSMHELYHPMSYVFDYRIRDVCEYIKSAFFSGENAYELVEEYFRNNYITYKEALLFYGRLLYPSYFFDLYDDIVNNVLEEKAIEEIVNKADDYESFLLNMHLFLSKLYNRYFPRVDWIIKRSFI